MITQELTQLVSQAFIANDLPAELGQVNPSDRPDLADFQCNGAMQAAGIAKTNPREIAQKIVHSIEESDAHNKFESIEIAGPGFINFKLSQELIEEGVSSQSKDDRFGVDSIEEPKKILLEFCSPNVAKNMHVGHMRTTFIGDTLARLFEYVGHDVVRMNYLGDWGTPMGIVIEEIRNHHPDLGYFDNGNPIPDDLPFDFETLVTFYPQGSARLKEDEAFAKRVHETTADFQKGHEGYRALWEAFRKITIEDVQKHLDFINAHHDVLEGESTSYDGLDEVLEDLKSRDMLEESDGAKVVRVQEESDNQEVPPLMMIKSNGAVGYGSAEIVTVKRRADKYSPDRMIIVTDYRQALHFVQVFRAAEKVGYTKGAVMEHIGYGTMNGPDGKPFKTRSGGVMTLDALISMAQEKATQRMKEISLDEKLSDEAFNKIRDQITTGALRFGDLSNAPRSDYVFDLDRFVSFEGKTGPYLQYAVVRLNALLAKAEESGDKPTKTKIAHESMRAIYLQARQYPEAVYGTLNNRSPNILAEYLFSLAQKMNGFYQQVHILSEEDEGKRGEYLYLVKFIRDILTDGLDLLGIEVPDQM